MPTAEPTYSIYDTLGGKETFHRLAQAFYRRVEADALLRPIYPKNLWGHGDAHSHSPMKPAGSGICSPVDSLAAFLSQFFGGPPEYSDARGHPRLRMRHVRFHIGQAERDAWLTHMYAAIDELGIEEPIRSVMRQYFDQASTFLINVPQAAP